MDDAVIAALLFLVFLVSAAVSFGLWMNSLAAGLFIFFFALMLRIRYE